MTLNNYNCRWKARVICGKFIKFYATKLNRSRKKSWIGLKMQHLVRRWMNALLKTYVHIQRQHDVMFKAIEIWSFWMSYEIDGVWLLLACRFSLYVPHRRKLKIGEQCEKLRQIVFFYFVWINTCEYIKRHHISLAGDKCGYFWWRMSFLSCT